MASDFVSAQIKVDHNMHVLHAICDDLVQGYYGDANEHRAIADYKQDLEVVENILRGLVYSIKMADTSREEIA